MLKGESVLLLQGPMGSFFKKVDMAIRKRGTRTFRIGLNAGDYFFSNKDNYTPYRGTQGEWEDFLYQFLRGNAIEKIFLYGDCRYYHKTAINLSKKLGLEVVVFEEGYIRPDFITMERYGVNDYSQIPRDRHFYEQLDTSKLKIGIIQPANNRYYRMGWSAASYYLLSVLLRHRYPHYQHHRGLRLLDEMFYGLRNIARKYTYKITERALSEKLLSKKKKYYFVPLQTRDDFQVRAHSKFPTIEAFVETVIYSFANFAPKNTHLVIKHHPLDRGRKDYKQDITTLAQALGVRERVLIIYDLHLPTCLKNAIGTITINSTVGISSLYHHIPTIALGRALYDIEGLTCKDMRLDDFWENNRPPERELFEKFRRYLIAQTQLNGGFYGRFPTELEEKA